jgi:glycosyltransferase involved in cell wall biosynthesis/NACalpha-BTF3-like transcription factor
MPKNQKNQKRGNGKKKSKQQRAAEKERKERARVAKLPFVSVCTPTFNRRPFMEYAIRNYLRQDYPQERMEWIIVDDGSDPIGDMVRDVSGVRYFYEPEKMKLGRKRNYMHDKAKGDILVYMDDDDYYPSDRVSHAVDMLRRNPRALCAGSSAIHIWFEHISKMFRFGPYGPNHSTAGTFAFRRELLLQTRYDDDAALAEEKSFLKNYTVPFVQLDPMKTILVFSHIHNTFDKRELLENWEQNKTIHETTVTVDDFIRDEREKRFYMGGANEALAEYKPGEVANKPDVVKQTEEIRASRQKRQQDQINSQKTPICIVGKDGKGRQLNVGEVQSLIQQLQSSRNALQKQNQQMAARIGALEAEVLRLRGETATSATTAAASAPVAAAPPTLTADGFVVVDAAGEGAPPGVTMEVTETTGAEEDKRKFSEAEVDLVAQQSGAPREKAREALERNDGDVVNTIMELSA